MATNLQALAASTDQAPVKTAEAIAMHGSILEQGGDADRAIQIYANNLTTATPADYRRAAFLRIIELTLGQNRLTEAAQQLEQFFAQYPRDAGSDLALLTLGELHLKQHSSAVETSRTNASYVVSTNHLYDALSRFERLRANFPESSLLGHMHLNRGWCYWEMGNISESQAAFRLATEKLQAAEHLAVARFKLADTQLRQRDYSGAIDNYRWAMREAAAVPTLKDPLSAQAFYQILRAMLEMGRLKEAEETMARLVEDYPDQLYGDRGLLLLGHGLVRAAKPAEARALFLKFAENRADSPLQPQVEFAIARSYAEEKEWQSAAQHYSSWLKRHGTNSLRPQVEFDRAWVHYIAGQETNALMLFTNFVARYPGTPLAAKAQLWVADFYLRTGNYTNAELYYQSTNVANVYEARMMAGRAAFGRHAYKDAQDYFTGLVNDDNCPPELAAEAFFALGDTFLLGEGDASSPIRKFDMAKEAYRRITHRYPHSRLVPLAWGQIGNCYFQMATVDPKHYADALDAYFRVLTPTNPASVTARSQAEFGIAQVYERQAKGPPERAELLKAALDYYLNIFNGKNLKVAETADPVWARESGFAAARLAEEQKQWALALNVYLGLRELAPGARDSLERKIARLREQAGSEKS
jgi:TolA-binding protein